MRLLGMDSLNKNNYKAIKINKNICVISSDSLNSEIEILKDKSDDEKRKSVVEKFLNQNTITKVLKEHANYVIVSLDGREMLITKEYVDNEMLSNIYNKYYMDRMMYYSTHDFDAYEIGTTSFEDYSYFTEYRNKEYGMEGVLRNKSVLKFYVPLIDDKLREQDERFLMNILGDIHDVYYYNSGWNNNVIYEAYRKDNIVYLNIDKELSWLLCKLRDKEDDEKEEKRRKVKERSL